MAPPSAMSGNKMHQNMMGSSSSHMPPYSSQSSGHNLQSYNQQMAPPSAMSGNKMHQNMMGSSSSHMPPYSSQSSGHNLQSYNQQMAPPSAMSGNKMHQNMMGSSSSHMPPYSSQSSGHNLQSYNQQMAPPSAMSGNKMHQNMMGSSSSHMPPYSSQSSGHNLQINKELCHKSSHSGKRWPRNKIKSVQEKMYTELLSLYEVKPHISKNKMSLITRRALKGIGCYKHIVQSVEKFIKNCPPQYKVPGLYVVDSIVRQSSNKFGADNDVFGPRFVKNITTTFQHLFKCSVKDRSKIIRILDLWQKNNVFPIDVIQPLLDMGHPNTSNELYVPRHKSSDSCKGWPQNTEESVQENSYAELVTAEGICLSNSISNCRNSMSQRSDIRLPLESTAGVRDSRPLSFQSAVLQPHIGASVAGRISPASSFTCPPAAGTSVQHRTSLVGVTSENPHVFHPISTQGVISTNSPITLYGRIPATSTSTVSPAHPAVLEWPHNIAVSAPLQRLQQPVSSVGAFSQPLYKSEATEATIFDATRQWQPCNPSFVDGTSSSQQSLSAVHVSLNMREEECKNRLKLRQDLEKVSPPPIFGTPVKVLDDGLSRRLKNLFGDPSLIDFDEENDKPQQ